MSKIDTFECVYKTSVNGKEFEVENGEDGVLVNGQLLPLDRVAISDHSWHIVQNNKTYTVELVSRDATAKTATLKINGRIYVVAWKDKFDVLLEKMGMAGGGVSRVNSIKAPMPGLIIEMKVKPGDAVKAGDRLVILEAMKMENVIKASGDAVVKAIKVTKGNSVEKGEILIEFA